MIYLIQASLALALLYILYQLFLSRTGFHRLNRLVLPAIALASLMVPILARQVPDLTPLPHIKADGFVKYTPSTFAPTNPIHPIRISLAPLIIAAIYALGLAICLARLIAPILALVSLIRKTPTHREAGYTLVEIKQPAPPFSFFNYIFLHKESYPPAQQTNILLHEQVHVQQHHTLDILFMECFTALAWFNPFAWLLNRQTKLNLEFLADQQMLKAGVEPKEYQYQLLQMSLGPSLTRMANYFNRSNIQKRIATMNRITRRTAIWKYGLFAPALIILTFIFASGKPQDLSKPGNSDIYVVIRANTSESLLRQIQNELAADGISLAFSGASYTANHELSGLRLTLSQNGQILEQLTIAADGRPMSQPLVFYWFRSRNGNPTLTRGYPSDVGKKDRKIMQDLVGLLRNNPGTREFDLHGSARIGD